VALPNRIPFVTPVAICNRSRRLRHHEPPSKADPDTERRVRRA